MRNGDARVLRLVEAFEGLTETGVPALARLYTPDAFFKDPFNEVRGAAAIEAIFRHMFTAVDAPRFIVHDIVVQGDQCFLRWDFRFRMKRFDRGEQTIRGGSHLHFADDGRVVSHRDYWDAAEELYEKLPLLGSLMRWLKRRAAG